MKRARKYNNKKITHKGITFDSKREFERYLVLDDMRKTGEITNLEVHPVFKLFCGDTPIMGVKQKNKQLVYTADFSYMKNGEMVTADFSYMNGELVVEDVKPHKTHKGTGKRYPYLDGESAVRMAVAQACWGFKITFVE